jgi:hypothetical protein
LPGLTRQSIFFANRILRSGWTRGSSPRVTPGNAYALIQCERERL